MLKDNLLLLRNIFGCSQEEVAGKVGVSRQAYAKWELGETIPNIEKCQLLADLYDVTIDNLINTIDETKSEKSFLVPKGKNIWGSVIINDRGQIVIPKGARDKFDLVEGKRLIVLSDEEGIALIPSEKFEKHIEEITELASLIKK